MDEILQGPRTSPREFFEQHINLEIPELSGIKAALQNDDIKLCMKIFADYIRKDEKQVKLRNHWQKSVDSKDEKGRDYIIERAKKVMDYQLVSCGIPYHFKNHVVDWEFNPTYNGYKEWPWQLSRHPAFTNLAMYYLLTKDENAVKTYKDMFYSWLKQAVVPVNTPPGATVCWRTIEAGIRMMSYIYQFASFLPSDLIDDEFITYYSISVFEHGRRLRESTSGGNWLIMELHGIVCCALTAPYLKYAEEWKNYAFDKLKKELSIQVYPDGFQCELTSGYHKVVHGNYTSIFATCDVLGCEIPKILIDDLEKMYNVYVKMMFPDRRMPNVNDSDREYCIENMKTALRYYPEREDFRYFTTWGKEGVCPDFLSCALPYAGMIAMRSDWSEDAVFAYMDCSPFGRAHQHEDKLNMMISAYGKQLLVEAGKYDYDSSEMRKYVLSTRGHNTIRINGHDQNMKANYRWHNEYIKEKADFKFETTKEKDMAEAEFSGGYGAESDKTIHRRKLLFFKNIEGTTPFFVVIDRLFAPDEEKRSFESTFHFEDCKFECEKLYASGDFGDNVGLTLAFSDENSEIKDMMGQYEPFYQGWYPIRPSGPHEHRKIHTPVLCGDFVNSKRIVTVLYPYKDGKNIVKSVQASADVNAKDFTVITKDGRKISLSE